MPPGSVLGIQLLFWWLCPRAPSRCVSKNKFAKIIAPTPRQAISPDPPCVPHDMNNPTVRYTPIIAEKYDNSM